MKFLFTTLSIFLFLNVSAANEIKRPNIVEPKHVYALSKLLNQNIDGIREKMGRARISKSIVEIKNAQPREVYFQAVNLLEKVEQLHFEITYAHEEKTSHEYAELNPGSVWDELIVSLSKIEKINEHLAISKVNELPSIIEGKTPSDVYTQILINVRQVNVLLAEPYTPSKVFQELSTALNYTFRLYKNVPSLKLQEMPKFTPNLTAANVYDEMMLCFSTISELSKHSGFLALEIAAIDKIKIKSGDVYDIATLINSELSFLDKQKNDGAYFYQSVYPGEKTPSHVYQRLRFLHKHLKALQKAVYKNKDWLK